MQEKNVVLYDLSIELKSLNELLAMEGGEITPEFEQLEKEVIASLSSKVDGYIGYANMLEDEILAAKKRIDELKDFMAVRKNSIERLKRYALLALETAGAKKFTGQFGEISSRKPVKVLMIHSEKNIPLEFIATEMVSTIDKTSLKRHLKAGEKITGCELIDGKKSVSFKNKSL